jgi:tyrosinase
MSNDKSDLLVLFGRPKEPIFLPRNDGKLLVEIPMEYYDNDRNEGVLDRVFTVRGGPVPERTIVVNKVDKLPNLEFAKSLDRDGAFSLFLVNHTTIAGKLIEIFMEPTTIPELMSISTYVRERVNPYLFQYAFSVALQHRPDTKELEVPSILSTLPEQFVDPKVMPKLMERAAIFEGEERVSFLE